MKNQHPLRAYREKHQPRLSLSELCKRFGVTKATLSRWETGQRKIATRNIRVVEQITGIPARELRPDLAQLIEPAE